VKEEIVLERQAPSLVAKKAKERHLALEKSLLAQAKRREMEEKVTKTMARGAPSNAAKRAERRTASGKFQVTKERVSFLW
jgi:hypothetical protein